MTKDVSVSEATPLTGEELRGMFGDHLPMEAVELIWPEHFSKRPHFDPLHIVREKLRAIALRSNLKEQEPVAFIPQVDLDRLERTGTVDCRMYRQRTGSRFVVPLHASPTSPVSREAVIEECAKLALGEIENARRAADPDHPESDYACGRVDAAAAIRSLSPTDKGDGWHTVDTAPSAMHVIACRFDRDAGEWVYAVVMSPPIYPFTHWRMLDAPPVLSPEVGNDK